MNLFQCIVRFFEPFRTYKRVHTPSEIAQKTLEKWKVPERALAQLLKANKQTVDTLEATCIIWGKLSSSTPEVKSEHIQLLKSLLQRLPIQARERALILAADSDFARVVSLLTALADLPLDGLAPLATTVKRELDAREWSSSLALAFYDIASRYRIPSYEATASQIRVLCSRGEDERAEAAFFKVFDGNPLPPADFYWSFISLEQHLQRSREQQAEALNSFIRCYPKDWRLGQAWQKIGDLYNTEEIDSQVALNAYMRAERYGKLTPQLQAYRAGNWESIPALRTHPDYLFPPIVAIDLEVDPLPGAPRGSRIFEVAAVRYKGQTCLDSYHSYIQRQFSPAKWTQEMSTSRLGNAPTVDVIVQQLHSFIGDALLIGHNICTFDALELKGIGLSIAREQMIDTLMVARLLHPDSLHHHLALLCQYYHVDVDQTMLHTALTDAHACAQLFHALGESLLQREPLLLTGIRALVRPGSAFDRALLQPRQVPADPGLVWKLDPAPVLSQVITPTRGNQASTAMPT